MIFLRFCWKTNYLRCNTGGNFSSIFSINQTLLLYVKLFACQKNVKQESRLFYSTLWIWFYLRFFDMLMNYNQFHNVLRLSISYQIFLSRQVKLWAIITYKHGIYKLPHELPNDLRLRILGNWKKLENCLDFIEL